MFNIKQKISDWRVKKAVNNKHFQATVDALRLAQATRYYQQFHHLYSENGAARDASFQTPKTWNNNAVFEELLTTPFEQQVDIIRDSFGKQLKTMFDYVHKTTDGKGLNPYPPHPLEQIAKKRTELSQNSFRNYLEPSSRDIWRNWNFQDGPLIEHPHGFSLQIRKSKIDHPVAGYGVFVEGRILPGTVIGLYPGVVYKMGDWTSQESAEKKGNEYLISRYDSVIVDGKLWDQQSWREHRSMQLLEQAGGTADPSRLLRRYRNPFGIINFVNHPSADTRANVFCFGYDFAISTNPNHQFEDPLLDYIPNEYAKTKQTPWKKYVQNQVNSKDVVMHAVVAVAINHIYNEELLLNYRLNPEHEYPPWYHQPDVEEARRRWTTAKMFSRLL